MFEELVKQQKRQLESDNCFITSLFAVVKEQQQQLEGMLSFAGNLRSSSSGGDRRENSGKSIFLFGHQSTSRSERNNCSKAKTGNDFLNRKHNKLDNVLSQAASLSNDADKELLITFAATKTTTEARNKRPHQNLTNYSTTTNAMKLPQTKQICRNQRGTTLKSTQPTTFINTNGYNNADKQALLPFLLRAPKSYVIWITMLALVTVTLQINFISLAEAIKLQPDGREKFFWSGEQVVVSCQNNNNIKNVKFRWIGPDGNEIRDDKSQRVHAELHGSHSHRLIVMEARESDNGVYRCVVGSADDKNPKTEEFRLKVYRSTSFADTERHSVQSVGSSGLLTCRILADPAATDVHAEWLRDGRPLALLADKANYRSTDFDASQQSSTLEILSLDRSHDGNYTCRVTTDTLQLTKISDFTISLETNYAPIVYSERHTVWIERHSPPSSSSKATTTDNNSVRVELRCTAQANPPARIVWSLSANGAALTKGRPEHVLDESVTIEKQNVTSVLVVNYTLDASWPHKRDKYHCAATNKIGSASKQFSVELGDLPPAFSVAPNSVRYNKDSQLLDLTILAPNFDPESMQDSTSANSQRQLVPPVDAFRVRTESQLLDDESRRLALARIVPAANGGGGGGGAPVVNSYNGRSNNNNLQQPVLASSPILSSRYRIAASRVEFASTTATTTTTTTTNNVEAANSADFDVSTVQAVSKFPLNVTLKLAKLEAGEQKLFLEAHNAVGWSPNATLIGDFVIVSSNSYSSNYSVSLVVLLAAQATCFVALAAWRRHNNSHKQLTSSSSS